MELYFYQVKKHGKIIQDKEYRTKEEMEKSLKEHKTRFISEFFYNSGKRIFDSETFIEVREKNK